jgi:hypothetical protein
VFSYPSRLLFFCVPGLCGVDIKKVEKRFYKLQFAAVEHVGTANHSYNTQ